MHYKHVTVIILTIGFLSICYSSPDEIFVSPHGNDTNPGTRALPLKSLECARDKVAGKLNRAGMAITLLSGSYRITTPFLPIDKLFNFRGAPLVLRGAAGDTAILSGGIELRPELSKPCDNQDIAAGIDPKCAGRIRKWSFDDLGIRYFCFWWMKNVREAKIPQLYCGDEMMTLAQWPHNGFAKIDRVLTTKPIEAHGIIIGDSVGRFMVKNARLEKWFKEMSHSFMHGYWFHDWWDNFELFGSIDTTERIIETKPPPNHYGYRTGQRWYAANLFCELDSEGEWAIEPAGGMIYFWPPNDSSRRSATLTINGDGLLILKNASNVRLENLTFENAFNDAIQFSACTSCTITGCVIRNLGGNGIILRNTVGTRITNCRIYGIGNSPIVVAGGERAKLISSNLVIANNCIHDFETIKKTYKPAIDLGNSTVGCRIAFNTIFNAPHSAIIFMGNNHVIEHNYIHHVCTETRDAGVIYTGRDWTARGTIIRNNFIEDCGSGDVNGIYLDDAASGIVVQGNIVKNVFNGIFIAGGRDNYIQGNVIINAKQWLNAGNRRGFSLKSGDAMDSELADRLAATPYTDSMWTRTYPALLTILDDHPGCPTGNTIKGNTIVNCDTERIDPAFELYGIVEGNVKEPSISINRSFGGAQKELDRKAWPAAEIRRMPAIPLIKSRYYSRGTLRIIPALSCHASKIKGYIINCSGKKCIQGIGADTVRFDGVMPGVYNYFLWYSDIPGQDSLDAAQETLHLMKNGRIE